MRRMFWRLIHLKISTEEWLDFLTAETIKKFTATQHRLIDWLLDHLHHYAPSYTYQWTGERVSSRVEGFFGTLKQRTGHQEFTLEELAEAIRKLAVSLLAKRLLPRRKPFCDFTILFPADQAVIGRKASKILQDEIKKLGDPKFDVEMTSQAIREHTCCDTAMRWKLPCVHLLKLRAGSEPRLQQSDFPGCVILSLLPRCLMPVFTMSRDAPDRTRMEPRWTPSGLEAYTGPLHAAALAGHKGARTILKGSVEGFAALTPPAKPGKFADPSLARAAGRRKSHPRDSSRLNGGVRSARKSRK
jgi:hypothetical protein